MKMTMNMIYSKIAKQNGVSTSEVKRDIQAAIDEIYKNPNLNIPFMHHTGDKPTPDEFIANLANNIKSKDDSEE